MHLSLSLSLSHIVWCWCSITKSTKKTALEILSFIFYPLNFIFHSQKKGKCPFLRLYNQIYCKKGKDFTMLSYKKKKKKKNTSISHEYDFNFQRKIVVVDTRPQYNYISI